MSDSNDTVHDLIIPSKSLKPAQLPSTSATVIELKLAARKAEPPAKPRDRHRSPAKIDMIDMEKKSQILKMAVTYCCSKSAGTGGFIADHTGDSLFAGYDGIVGGAHLDKAYRSSRKLIKLMNQADDVMTVELRSLASVAGLILQEAEEPGMELIDRELEYLKSFVRLVGRYCHEQYEREWSAANKQQS